MSDRLFTAWVGCDMSDDRPDNTFYRLRNAGTQYFLVTTYGKYGSIGRIMKLYDKQRELLDIFNEDTNGQFAKAVLGGEYIMFVENNTIEFKREFVEDIKNGNLTAYFGGNFSYL